MRCRPFILGGALAFTAVASAHAAKPRFSDQTVQAGIAFEHNQTGQHYAGPMSGGGAVADFNRDGYPDLFLIGGGDVPDALYINNRDGTFSDRAAQWGLDAAHRGTGCAVGDIDGDGDEDLFVTSGGGMDLPLATAGQHRLYRNDGRGFTDVAAAAGVNRTSDYPDGFGATFGDYDLDGDLDLFVAAWRSTGVNAAFGSRLFRNRGDGTFDDVTAESGVMARSTQAFGAVFADMNGDGWPELLVAGDFGTSRYYRNNGDGTFAELDPGSGALSVQQNDPDWSIGKAHNGMGTSVADIDGDGRPDWFLTAIWPTFHFESAHWGNGLYFNLGDHRFAEAAPTSGIADGGWGWGTVSADVDHDGRRDILMTNGWPNDDDVTGEGFRDESSYLFWQRPDGAFEDIARKAGLVHTAQGRGLMTLDYDADGDLDIVILANRGSARLYRNELIGGRGAPVGGDAHWLQLAFNTQRRADLAPGGLGAYVKVRTGERVQHGWVTSGGSYLSDQQRVLHFGLGSAQRAEEVTVTWPDGQSRTLHNVRSDRRLTMRPGR